MPFGPSAVHVSSVCKALTEHADCRANRARQQPAYWPLMARCCMRPILATQASAWFGMAECCSVRAPSRRSSTFRTRWPGTRETRPRLQRCLPAAPLPLMLHDISVPQPLHHSCNIIQFRQQAHPAAAWADAQGGLSAHVAQLIQLHCCVCVLIRNQPGQLAAVRAPA